MKTFIKINTKCIISQKSDKFDFITFKYSLINTIKVMKSQGTDWQRIHKELLRLKNKKTKSN